MGAHDCLGGSCVRTRCGADANSPSDRAAPSNSGSTAPKSAAGSTMAWIATRRRPEGMVLQERTRQEAIRDRRLPTQPGPATSRP